MLTTKARDAKSKRLPISKKEETCMKILVLNGSPKVKSDNLA